MFSTMRSAFQLTTVLVALAANACAAQGGWPVAGAATKPSCAGGLVRTAADAARYGACERVDGDLRISTSELSDLSALSGLRRVSGKLEIDGNTRLDDLSGLEQLQQVGSLSIHDNAELDDLSGLENLRGARDVEISGNTELASLRGLEGLTHVETLVIAHNGLYQTTGLGNLTDVGELAIGDNPKLNSLHGLGSLAHARSVQIRNNPRLCARGMLPALTHVDHELSLSANRGLSQPDVRRLLSRIEHDMARPSSDGTARLEASLH